MNLEVLILKILEHKNNSDIDELQIDLKRICTPGFGSDQADMGYVAYLYKHYNNEIQVIKNMQVGIGNNIINRQNNILKSYTKKNLFSGYIKYLKETIYKAEEEIKNLEIELTNFDINSYLELFEYIDNIRIYNSEIDLYKEKIEQATKDTDIISFNNKITALNIKLRRAESSLVSNEYYDSKDKASNKKDTEVTEETQDDEIKKMSRGISNGIDK